MCNLSKVCLTKKEAEAFLHNRNNQRYQYRKEIRAYYCSFCNAWHLTSQELNEEPLFDDTLKYKKKWKKLLKKGGKTVGSKKVILI